MPRTHRPQRVAHLPRGKERGAPRLWQLWGQGQDSDRGKWLMQLGAKHPDTRTSGRVAGSGADLSCPTQTELPATVQAMSSVTGRLESGPSWAFWP